MIKSIKKKIDLLAIHYNYKKCLIILENIREEINYGESCKKTLKYKYNELEIAILDLKIKICESFL